MEHDSQPSGADPRDPRPATGTRRTTAWHASIVDTIAGWVRSGIERIARGLGGHADGRAPTRRGDARGPVPALVPARPRVRSGMRGARARRGFTIVELLVALSAMTAVAAVSIWAYFSRAEITLENAARLLVQDVQLAQTRASYSRAPVEFVFLPMGDGYFVRNADEEGVLPSEKTPRRYSIDAIFEGVSIARKTFDSGKTIRIAADGHLETEAMLVLTFDGHARTVLVDRKANVAVLADGTRSSSR